MMGWERRNTTFLIGPSFFESVKITDLVENIRDVEHSNVAEIKEYNRFIFNYHVIDDHRFDSITYSYLSKYSRNLDLSKIDKQIFKIVNVSMNLTTPTNNTMASVSVTETYSGKLNTIRKLHDLEPDYNFGIVNFPNNNFTILLCSGDIGYISYDDENLLPSDVFDHIDFKTRQIKYDHIYDLVNTFDLFYMDDTFDSNLPEESFENKILMVGEDSMYIDSNGDTN